MLRKKNSDTYQKHLFKSDLLEQIDPRHPLLHLAKVISWKVPEEKFTPLYAKKGRSAKPIRLMLGLLILKQLENLSDERVVEQWRCNPYYQAFCGEHFFQWTFPCDPSDITYFRGRIGDVGAEEIFRYSICIHGEDAQEKDIVVDTTVQEKILRIPLIQSCI